MYFFFFLMNLFDIADVNITIKLSLVHGKH